MNTERPTINLAVHSQVHEQNLTHLLLGMEEEGVPWAIERHDELNPLTLAHQAATSSRLGIGIGVALDYVVITTDKLPEQRPYLAHHLGTSVTADRVIGSNAARLVKRLPLRLVETERSQ